MIQIIPTEDTKYETLIFIYMQTFGYYTLFWACWNEGNLWETNKDNYRTFRYTTYIKAIRLPLSSNVNHFHGIEHGRGCVNKSSPLRTRKWTEWEWKGTSFHTVGKNFIIWKLIIKVDLVVSSVFSTNILVININRKDSTSNVVSKV